jgi:hypothetical protein
VIDHNNESEQCHCACNSLNVGGLKKNNYRCFSVLDMMAVLNVLKVIRCDRCDG